MKNTQKYLCVRYMAGAKKIGEWFCSHELVGRFVGTQTLGITPMERLYEIINNDKKIFTSDNFIYELDHRAPRRDGNPTRFAQFRIKRKTPKETYGLKDWTHGQPQLHYSV